MREVLQGKLRMLLNRLSFKYNRHMEEPGGLVDIWISSGYLNL